MDIPQATLREKLKVVDPRRRWSRSAENERHPS
jgi:hypothetical protein